MSSTYRVLCMSHDPALTIDVDFSSSSEAVAAVLNVSGGDVDYRLASHAQCDLLIGRFSYPLVEVCCVGRPGLTKHPRLQHPGDKWVDAQWLRLMYGAMGATGQLGEAADAIAATCWTWPRISRLRCELGIEQSEEA